MHRHRNGSFGKRGAKQDEVDSENGKRKTENGVRLENGKQSLEICDSLESANQRRHYEAIALKNPLKFDLVESSNEVPVKQAKRFLQSKNVSSKTSEALFAKQKCFL